MSHAWTFRQNLHGSQSTEIKIEPGTWEIQDPRVFPTKTTFEGTSVLQRKKFGPTKFDELFGCSQHEFAQTKQSLRDNCSGLILRFDEMQKESNSIKNKMHTPQESS